MRRLLYDKDYIPISIRRWWHWQIEQRWIMSRFNPNSIRPGDFYESCNYLPHICVKNSYGEIQGVSLIDGRLDGCSAFHCGPVKLSLKEAFEAKRAVSPIRNVAE